MAIPFRIPKLTDRDVIAALAIVRDELKEFGKFEVGVNVTPLGGVILDDDPNPLQSKKIKSLLTLDSIIFNRIYLCNPNQGNILAIDRRGDASTDLVSLDNGWNGNSGQQHNPQSCSRFYALLIAAARRELKALEIDLNGVGNSDSDWSRFRAAQANILESLQKTNESIIAKVAENNLRLEEERSKRFGELEDKLRDQFEKERVTLLSDIERKKSEHEEQEKILADKQAKFETKEARYVARQQQQEQIEQIQKWLEDWSLTRGTMQKRSPIAIAYISALIAFGSLTIYVNYHNFVLLHSVDDIAKLAWWQWAVISLKAVLPFAAFTSFMIYFIRWSSSWARQHAEEEFRNRARLVDIGRSSWLLEAVSDAHGSDKQIPPELLKELSKNLFSYTGSGESDIHPNAISDILLQGISNIRVKTSDGSEVEATRSKKR